MAATHISGSVGDGWAGRSAAATVMASVIPIRSCPALNATLCRATRFRLWPMTVPVPTASVSTSGRTSTRPATHTTSVRENISFSSPCR